MLTTLGQMEIAVLKRHGTSIRAIARATGLSRNTVRRYLRGGNETATRKPAPRRPQKLDPCKDYITERMAAAAPNVIPATVLLREVRLCALRQSQASRCRLTGRQSIMAARR